ncbi:hypothetical protein RRG08_020113 [Elysia crispata]|uniref:Uncharacterized protein n=1 Tax=Elysia crispata TaxID=231223 RepID=A0AAE1A586_9GAST|nr:hypothetical protein RRG08_020113 [Elysia crispata]
MAIIRALEMGGQDETRSRLVEELEDSRPIASPTRSTHLAGERQHFKWFQFLQCRQVSSTRLHTRNHITRGVGQSYVKHGHLFPHTALFIASYSTTYSSDPRTMQRQSYRLVPHPGTRSSSDRDQAASGRVTSSGQSQDKETRDFETLAALSSQKFLTTQCLWRLQKTYLMAGNNRCDGSGKMGDTLRAVGPHQLISPIRVIAVVAGARSRSIDFVLMTKVMSPQVPEARRTSLRFVPRKTFVKG